VDNIEQASRHLQLFHAHLAHSLDSIMEDPENGKAEVASILSIRRMRKAQTESCLSQLDSSQPHTFAHRFPATKLENETDEWEFGIDETMNIPPNNGSKPWHIGTPNHMKVASHAILGRFFNLLYDIFVIAIFFLLFTRRMKDNFY
jgi:hypothetical protein